MLKSPSLPKLLLCLLFWLSFGQSMRVSAQGPDDGFYDDSGRGDSFGGERFGGFRERGGFRGGPPGGDFEGRGFGGEGRFGRDWGGEEGGRWGRRGGGSRDGFGPPDGGEMHAGPGTSTGSSGPAARVRITVDIPQTFQAGDLDRDGQIGLYEWRQWRRGDMAGFLALDHNGDGYLTPAELVKGPRTPNVGSAGMSIGLVSAEGASLAGPPSGTGAPSVGAPAGGSPEAARAASMFRLLDSNHNEQLDPDEWAKAKNIRGQFEAAKIDMAAAMPKEEFIKNFVNLNRKP